MNGHDTTVAPDHRIVPTLQALVALAMGALCVRLALTGEFVRYVKSSLRPWLWIAGVAIVLAALAELFAVRSQGSAGTHEGHTHSWGHVGLLLALPIVAVVAVAPPPLGSFALRRNPVVITKGSRASFPPLARSTDPLAMSLYEVTARVSEDGVSPLAGQPLRLRGFIVTGSASGNRVRLARFRIACCAADAAPSVVELVLDRAAPSGDTWIDVVAEVIEEGHIEGMPLARLRVHTMAVIPPPVDPYEEV